MGDDSRCFKKVEDSGLVSFEITDVIVNAASKPIPLHVSRIPVTGLKADKK